MAQLKLAEQIIAEKDHDLYTVRYRADMAAMEKAALEEELATMKSNGSSFQDTPQHESTPTRVSAVGGCGFAIGCSIEWVGLVGVVWMESMDYETNELSIFSAM